MEGRHLLEVSLSVKKMKNEKSYREKLLAVIVSVTCALLNSGGGKMSVKFEDDPVLIAEVDDVLRMMEQRLVNIIGDCTFNSTIKMSQFKRSEISKQLVFIVDSVPSLCTVNYNLYLPTQAQVILISPHEPSENVKAVFNREVPNEHMPIPLAEFVLNHQIPLIESDSIQFKKLKAEKSTCVSLAVRMTNKSNKLDHYISGFANKNGGCIYYGITNDGIVEGEKMEQKYQENIVTKVLAKTMQMIWCGGKLERSKHWEIRFVPVKDENMKEIPSLFVIILSIAPLRGGLFTAEPESYHVVKGRAERMSFTKWRRMLYDVDKQPTKVMVPSFSGRTQWSSENTQIISLKVLQKLLMYQNNGNFPGFENFAAFAEQNYKDNETVLFFILAERSDCAYKRGEIEKAKSLVRKFEDTFSSKDKVLLTFRAIYAKSAIARASGDYNGSYKIAQEGLQLAELVPAGIITAWFYNHVAIVEKILSKQQSAQDHFIKALQHTHASNVEQEFSITIADSQQRIHIIRAIMLLGDIATGANYRKATPSDIEAAKTELSIYHELVAQGYKETNYRKIDYLLLLSDLRMCQWWQQQTQEQRSSETETPNNLLQQSLDYATEAKELSKKCSFEELVIYANNRLSVYSNSL